MTSIRCDYCSRVARLSVPGIGTRLCTSCADAVIKEQWDELARRQLKHHPEAWVTDVAASIRDDLAPYAEEWEGLLPPPPRVRR